ncbi:hypothetical protein CSQ85_04310 [Bifidobacterium rousetti]|uniref:variant leucine-rich repeat-containing protein n=1 Tax=Bifidobacterium rousetti TaxID=2045439 RepID=UPI0012387C52|nr:hypothetical protein [Bifidobacterium rousetti]KAA8819911.1 hypothetical protein CSQ85_04310 [Bifidobacterium rousetti]
MVDYDAAVAAVQDPDADPVFLAKIAYENPEFGANVAVNPRAYPGLIRWLAEFGDDRARETVAQLGYAVPDNPSGAGQTAGQTAAQPEPVRSESTRSATSGQSATSDRQPRSVRSEQYVVTGQGTGQTTVQPVSFTSQPTAAYGQDAYVQPARNPYGFTAAQAATTTDQMQMAEIARSAPELYADLACNPNLYPALVDWLAQLHDPAVDAALARRSSRF